MISESVEVETGRLHTEMLGRTIGGQPFITCNQILKANIPSFIKDSFLNQAKKKIIKDKPLTINPTNEINFDAIEIKTKIEQLFEALVSNVVFKRVEYEDYLYTLIQFNMLLHIYPIQSLETAIFGKATYIDKDKFCNGLNKISSISILFNKVLQKIINENISKINQHIYKSIGQECIHIIFNDNSNGYLLEDFKKLYHFLSLNENQPISTGVPADLLKDFLISRGKKNFIVVIDKKITQGKTTWNINDFSNLDALYKEERKETLKNNIGLETSTSSKKKPSRPKIVFSSQDEKFTIYRNKIEKQPPGPYPPLKKIISSKEQRNFVKKIFNSDFDAYFEFIQNLDKTEKWKTAKHMIDHEFEKRDIDSYCKEALKFGNKVFAKFFSNS